MTYSQPSPRSSTSLRDLEAQISAHVTQSIRDAPSLQEPFYHLEFSQVFPAEVYSSMMISMPDRNDYRAMSGRSRAVTGREKLATRIKFDLFPEFIRCLPEEKRGIWTLVAATLRSSGVQKALTERLAPGLQKRFGAKYPRVGLYPIPILTRDIPGYQIPPHTDTHWKGITVQFYLPPDESVAHIGTVFHRRNSDGSFGRARQMRFAPNTGYAFAVGDDTWHSVETVGPEVQTRDSILHTYFVDDGPFRWCRNRGKRLGNLMRQGIRMSFR